jgi:hypothetical protein
VDVPTPGLCTLKAKAPPSVSQQPLPQATAMHPAPAVAPATAAMPTAPAVAPTTPPCHIVQIAKFVGNPVDRSKWHRRLSGARKRSEDETSKGYCERCSDHSLAPLAILANFIKTEDLDFCSSGGPRDREPRRTVNNSPTGTHLLQFLPTHVRHGS